jgi:hypothetical protein
MLLVGLLPKSLRLTTFLLEKRVRSARTKIRLFNHHPSPPPPLVSYITPGLTLLLLFILLLVLDRHLLKPRTLTGMLPLLFLHHGDLASRQHLSRQRCRPLWNLSDLRLLSMCLILNMCALVSRVGVFQNLRIFPQCLNRFGFLYSNTKAI